MENEDEIKQYAYGKLLCASDAAWTFFGFQNYPKSIPSSVLVKAKTEEQIANITADGKYM